MSIEILNSKDLGPNTSSFRLKCLVYGASGTFKTPFAATFPAPIFLDCDEGMMSVRTAEVNRVSFKDKPMGERWPHLMDASRELVDSDACNTIVADSITTASEFAMYYTQMLNGRTGKKPNWDDWGSQKSMLQEWIELLLSSDKNIVVIAHEDFVSDENTGRIWCLPLVTGKMKQRLPIYFDEVYHSEALMGEEGMTYRLLSKATEVYIAKSRLVKSHIHLPPSYDEILELVKEEG